MPKMLCGLISGSSYKQMECQPLSHYRICLRTTHLSMRFVISNRFRYSVPLSDAVVLKEFFCSLHWHETSLGVVVCLRRGTAGEVCGVSFMNEGNHTHEQLRPCVACWPHWVVQKQNIPQNFLSWNICQKFPSYQDSPSLLNKQSPELPLKEK